MLQGEDPIAYAIYWSHRIAKAAPMDRRKALYDGSRRLGRLVGAGELGAGIAKDALWAGAREGKLAEGEARMMIREGFEWGLDHPRPIFAVPDEGYGLEGYGLDL
jgi:hypothetical protein